MSASRSRRRLLAVTTGIVGALLLLELVLQVGALVLERSQRGGGETQWQRGDADAVVLCIGDSFTFGLHASTPEHSYPAIAQRLVGDFAERVAVVNEGVPGRTSRELLERLPQQLRRYRPDVVCVLVGTNDFYFRPARLPEASAEAADGGFVWRWRTWRLLQLAFGRSASAQGEGGRPFVGVWHSNSVTIEFAADGRFLIGDAEWRWRDDAPAGLRLLTPDDVELPVEWRLEQGRLWLRCAAWDPPHLLERGVIPGPIEGILADHLVRVVARCRQAGAAVLLLTYPGGPYAAPGLNACVRRVAAEQQVACVDLEDAFAALGSGAERAEHFVGDGHCSDRGNEVVAREVVGCLRALLR